MCLLLKTNPQRGDFWQPVTGSVEENEGFFEAACREPMEETKLPFAAPPLDTGLEFEFVSRFGPTRERIFTLYVEDMPEPILDPKEHNAFEWLSPKDVLGRLKYRSNVDGLFQSYELIFSAKLDAPRPTMHSPRSETLRSTGHKS